MFDYSSVCRALCLFNLVLLAACSGGGGSGGNPSAAYTVGGAVSGLVGSGLVLQNNGGDNLKVSTNGTFAFTTALQQGGVYQVTVLVQPNTPPQFCTVSNGVGTLATTNIASVSVKCTNARFAFATNGPTSSVLTYVVDAETGRLKYIGSVAAGTDPAFAAVDPTGQYLYVANDQDNTVSQYVIGADGTLTPLAAAVNAGTNPISIAIAPSGQYAYVANENDSGTGGTVSQYSVGSDGVLTPLSPATVAAGTAGTNPESVTVDPSGRYVYVADNEGGTNDGAVLQYAIGSNGALTPLSTPSVPSGVSPFAVTVDPSGKYVYVANEGDNTISQYVIGSNGALAPLSTPTVLAGTNPFAVTVDLSGKYAYVVNENGGSGGTVSQYAIGSNGALTPLSTSSVSAGTGPVFITVDPADRYVYVANNGGSNISEYAIQSSGALASLAPATVGAPAGGLLSLAVSHGNPVKGVAHYAYVANFGDGTVSQYTVGANGSLVASLSGPVATGSGPTFVAVDPTGQYLYITNKNDGNVSQYTISDGTLSTSTTFTAGNGAVAIAIDPTGQYAYVANLVDGTVSQYTVGAGGSLTSLSSPIPTGLDPISIVVDPSGQYVYVANEGDNTVSQYVIGSDGTLTAPSAAVNAGNNPISIVVDPSGRYAYVANENDTITGGGTVSQYAIGSDGTLNPLSPATVTAETEPESIVVDPSGRYVYVANDFASSTINTGDGYLSQYAIGSDGALTPLTPTAVPAGASPFAVAIDPTGQYAYVVDENGAQVSQYVIGSGGGLTSAATFGAGNEPFSIAIVGGYQ